jgi:hypothetical protein
MNVPGIVWPTTYSKERFLKMVNPSRINWWSDDYRDMMKEEDSFDSQFILTIFHISRRDVFRAAGTCGGATCGPVVDNPREGGFLGFLPL